MKLKISVFSDMGSWIVDVPASEVVVKNRKRDQKKRGMRRNISDPRLANLKLLWYIF